MPHLCLTQQLTKSDNKRAAFHPKDLPEAAGVCGATAVHQCRPGASANVHGAAADCCCWSAPPASAGGTALLLHCSQAWSCCLQVYLAPDPAHTETQAVATAKDVNLMWRQSYGGHGQLKQGNDWLCSAECKGLCRGREPWDPGRLRLSSAACRQFF